MLVDTSKKNSMLEIKYFGILKTFVISENVHAHAYAH